MTPLPNPKRSLVTTAELDRPRYARSSPTRCSLHSVRAAQRKHRPNNGGGCRMLDLQPILSCRSHLCHGRRRHVEADEDRQRSAIETSERRLALQGRYLGSLVRLQTPESCRQHSPWLDQWRPGDPVQDGRSMLGRYSGRLSQCRRNASST